MKHIFAELGAGDKLTINLITLNITTFAVILLLLTISSRIITEALHVLASCE